MASWEIHFHLILAKRPRNDGKLIFRIMLGKRDSSWAAGPELELGGGSSMLKAAQNTLQGPHQPICSQTFHH